MQNRKSFFKTLFGGFLGMAVLPKVLPSVPVPSVPKISDYEKIYKENCLKTDTSSLALSGIAYHYPTIDGIASYSPVRRGVHSVNK